MQERLYKIGDRRLRNLTRLDLPEVANALVAYQRHRCGVSRQHAHEIAFYHFRSIDGRIDSYIRADDWLKILPFVLDGKWNPDIVAVPQQVSLTGDPLKRTYDASLLTAGDRALYDRILADLESVFTTEFPTSSL